MKEKKERKSYIKYLGVIIDDSMSWKHHITYICSCISRNTEIMSKLRPYLSVKQLKQVYYNIIYPYISYAIMARGSTYKSNLEKVQVKQNHIIRMIFFATLYGKETASATPLLNLLDILSVHNVYCLHVLKFTHLWRRGMLPIVASSETCSDMLGMYIVTIQDMWSVTITINEVSKPISANRQFHLWQLPSGKISLCT